MQFRGMRGLTLVELMVTIMVLALLAVIAAPGVRDFMLRNRSSAQSLELVASVNLARAEAIKGGVQATICKSANPTAASPGCTNSGAWEQGWIVFVDRRANPTDAVAPDDMRRAQAPLEANMTAVGVGTFDAGITFLPNGMPKNIGGSAVVKFCPNVAGVFGVEVTVNATGRPSSKGEKTCP